MQCSQPFDGLSLDQFPWSKMPKPQQELVLELGQECLRADPPPVLVLGSGASAPFGLPTMRNLADHLVVDSPPPKGESSHADELWEKVVTELENGIDLESTLQKLQLTDSLIDHIITETWSLISTADLAIFDRLINDSKTLPLSRLYRHLFDSTNLTVSVVTTNYDRLAEYAADCCGFSHYTGFTHGYLRNRSPRLTEPRPNQTDMNRTVNVWKVHGCLDWFINDTRGVFAVSLANRVPSESQPAIITPGITKYEQTHREPFRSILTAADTALMRASAYLCIGFGFNDEHIQQVLLQRWRQGEAMLVILTKMLSDSTKSILTQSHGNRFLSAEEVEKGTRVRTHENPDGFLLPDHDLWSLDSFLSYMI